jgi:hypothetical protein
MQGAISGPRQSLRGSSDVICGIHATARGVRPQAKRAPSTVDRDRAVNDWNKTESSTALLPQVLISGMADMRLFHGNGACWHGGAWA